MINICSATKLISNKELFLKVLNSGFTHLRINFSHIKNEEASMILGLTKDNYPDIKIIQDLQGPKIRIGDIESLYINDIYTLDKYKMFVLVKEGETAKYQKNLPAIPICFENYKLLKGTKKFILTNKDYQSTISVLDTAEYDWGTAFICMSDSECVFRAEKGLNAIGFDRTKIVLSEKDKKDVLWGLEHHVDIIILSFVSKVEQLIELKAYIKEYSDYMPLIWAKIECLDGITNADLIIEKCDGFMIGRGDLSIEIPLIDLPKAQNDLILICSSQNKECIVATHLFDNYKDILNISDITAIFHLKAIGATGFMMSNEVIFSKNPIKISQEFSIVINK